MTSTVKELNEESSSSDSVISKEQQSKLDSELEDVLDDLYQHVNEEQDSDMGIQDLKKLKKRLFDPEFQHIQ